MQYRILRKLEGEWMNLYPQRPTGTPMTFEMEKDAEETALRIKKRFGTQTKVVTKKEAQNYETPKRDSS